MRNERIGFVCGLIGMLFLIGCNEQKETGNDTPSRVPTITQTEDVPTSIPTDVTESTKKPENGEWQSSELQFSYKEEENEETEGETTYFRSCILYPEFSYGNGAEAVNEFVESLLTEFRLYLSEAEENAKYDYEDFKIGEFSDFIFPEVQEYTVSVLWQDEQRIALYVQNYSNTGGAHPNAFGVAYTINKTDGKQVECEAILVEYDLTVGEVAEYVAAQIRERDGEALYVTDDEATLTEWVTNFLEGNQWYLNEHGLVIFANPYDIAPYAYGVIECKISYEDLEQGLKKD